MSIAYLKLLSGMHQDALVPIDHSEIVIGGSDNVDIVLADDFLKGLSFSVEVSSLGYRLHSSDESLVWSMASQTISGHKLILYKTHDLILGFSDDQSVFSQININDLQFEPYSESQPIDAPQDHAVDDSAVHDEEISSEGAVEEHRIYATDDDYHQGADDDDSGEADLEGSSSILTNKKLLVVGCSVIALTLFGLGYFSFHDAGSATHVPTIACEAQFKSIFSEPAYQQLHLTSQSEVSTRFIQGYVDSYEDLIALKNKAQKLSCATIDHVYSNQQILSNIKNMLPQELLSTVKVLPGQLYGHVIVEGYAKDQTDWGKVKSRMLQDVNGLLSIEDKVATVQTHFTFLNQLINKYQLDGYVHLKVNGDKIVSDMVFNPSMHDKWKQMLVAYQEVYPVGPELVMDNVNITQLGIAGISQGRMAHIVLENGEKYVVGAVLPNGSVLTRVDDDGLVLSTVNGEIKYPISTLF
jgi:hypothetical protein